MEKEKKFREEKQRKEWKEEKEENDEEDLKYIVNGYKKREDVVDLGLASIARMFYFCWSFIGYCRA